MKQGKITAAFKAILELYAKPGLPLADSRKLFLLKKDMEPLVEWQQAQERKAQEENSGGIDSMGAFIMTAKDRVAVAAKFKEIQETEAEWNRGPIQIRVNDALAADLGITGRMMDQLDGFVEFTEE